MNTITPKAPLTAQQLAQRAAGEQPPAANGDGAQNPQPVDHFSESSASLRRDGFLGASLLGTCIIPYAGHAIGIVGGPLTMLTGFSEMREGMRNASTREVLNGVAHMAVGGALLGCGLAAQPLTHAWLLSVGLAPLAIKVFADHPTLLPGFVAKEAVGLVKDGFQSAVDLVKFSGDKKNKKA